jgi:predicted Zn finger-like uncharacterized protein
MAPDQVTRCPHCQAVFRVTPEQLAQAQGWLRCGQCREVFDSTGLRVLWQPDADAGVSRMDLKDFLQKEDPGAAQDNSASDALLSFEQALATFPGRAPLSPSEPLASTDAPDHEVPQPSPLATAPARRRWGWMVLLALLMLAQLAWAVRAAWWQTPWIAASAQALCARGACTLPAFREPEQLFIDSSRLLRTDEGYRLEWGLRNRSLWPVHMPAMELVLTGPSDAAVVRRVVQPADMMAPERLEPGQLWEAALGVQVEDGLDVSGYRLRVFYP